jgi:ubiquinone/menaquinone biosynthesis C-methylase UbiE
MGKISSSNIEENKKLFDKWSNKYDFFIFQFWMKGFHRPVLKQLKNEEIKVLDISCGTGELLKELHGRKPLLDLSGIDLSSKMLEQVKRKLGNKVKIIEGDVHNLPYENETFDIVITTEAFHHYHSPSLAIKEMKRVLVNKGKLIIVDVNFFIRPINKILELFEPGCVKVNSRKEMYKLFSEGGFTGIIQTRSFLFAVMTVGIKKD